MLYIYLISYIFWKIFIFLLVVICMSIFSIVLQFVQIAYYTLAERKTMASTQRRRGPNVVGPWGLLQPLADGLKLVNKQQIAPRFANYYLFIGAPILFLTCSLFAWFFICLNDNIVVMFDFFIIQNDSLFKYEFEFLEKWWLDFYFIVYLIKFTYNFLWMPFYYIKSVFPVYYFDLFRLDLVTNYTFFVKYKSYTFYWVSLINFLLENVIDFFIPFYLFFKVKFLAGLDLIEAGLLLYDITDKTLYGLGTVNFSTSILFILAISSLNVYCIIVSGWASNSKYAFLGSLRSAAQMISYEVSLGLTILPVILVAGSTLNVKDLIVKYFLINHQWLIFFLFPSFVIFLISMLAETNRTPFDLTEAEAELVAGYNVEYSSITFAMFFLAEYSNMLLMSVLITIFFFGGTSVWSWVIEILTFNFLFILIRASFPRYKYNELMDLGWKRFLPLSLSFLVYCCCLLFFFDAQLLAQLNTI